MEYDLTTDEGYMRALLDGKTVRAFDGSERKLSDGKVVCRAHTSRLWDERVFIKPCGKLHIAQSPEEEILALAKRVWPEANEVSCRKATLGGCCASVCDTRLATILYVQASTEEQALDRLRVALQAIVNTEGK